MFPWGAGEVCPGGVHGSGLIPTLSLETEPGLLLAAAPGELTPWALLQS